MKALSFDFEVKNDSKTKSLEIEGLANASVKDRVGDLIPKDAWDLTEFKKLPIILFNHDQNHIVGKATAVEPTDEGLKIRVRLSNSKEGKVPYVRDLVQEGILKAFSVGFNDHGSAEKNADGINVIKRAELLETSIVSIPMNQDSLFTVVAGGQKSGSRKYYTKKHMSAKDMSLDACQNYDDMKEMVLNQKGAWVAAAIHNAIYEAQKQGADRDAILDQMLDALEISRDQLDDVMAGNVTPVPEPVLVAAAEILEMDLESLQGLNAGDVEVSEGEQDEPETPEEQPEEEAADETPAQEEDKAEDPEKEDEEDKAMDDEEEDKDDKAAKDFQECVSSKIPKLLEEGLERDQAIAQAISMCESENKCSASPSMVKDAIVAYNAKQEGEVSQPVENSQSESGPKEEFEQGQPSITLQKSQLALTGSMVELMKEMVGELRKLNDAMAEKSPVDEEEDAEKAPAPEPVEPDNNEDAEKIARITRDMAAIAESQKKLNKLLSS